MFKIKLILPDQELQLYSRWN